VANGPAVVQSLVAPVKGRVDPLARVLVTPELESANWSPGAELRAIQGYNPLVLLTIARLLGQSDPAELAQAETGSVGDTSLASASSHVLDLLRCGMVRTVGGRFVDDPLGRAIAAAAGAGSEPRWEEIVAARRGNLSVYVNRRARPLAWLVGRVRVATAAEILAKVRGTSAIDDFDPAREALSEQPIAGVPGALSTEATPPRLDAAVEVVSYEEDRFTLRIESPAPALLVTSELAYPGWWATVDDRDTPIHTVDAGFRSVVVPAGRHEVRFAYVPWLGRIGLGASALGLLVLLACLVAAAVRRRAKPGPRLSTAARAPRRTYS
jgi:Bacterial membrane protein YfhO